MVAVFRIYKSKYMDDASTPEKDRKQRSDSSAALRDGLASVGAGKDKEKEKEKDAKPVGRSRARSIWRRKARASSELC